MKEITKDTYIASISDYEKLFLIHTENGEVYLRADIEYGGEICLRIEMMDFDMNPDLLFSEACSECCGRYAGGITFIEYETFDDAQKSILSDFLSLGENAFYLSCSDDEMRCVAEKYLNNEIYILVSN